MEEEKAPGRLSQLVTGIIIAHSRSLSSSHTYIYSSVPTDFYQEMWLVVERCQGISVGSELLSNHTTHEMTAGEMKFHLRCETLLNAVKDPEFRSLVVEAIMILIKVRLFLN